MRAHKLLVTIAGYLIVAVARLAAGPNTTVNVCSSDTTMGTVAITSPTGWSGAGTVASPYTKSVVSQTTGIAITATPKAGYKFVRWEQPKFAYTTPGGPATDSAFAFSGSGYTNVLDAGLGCYTHSKDSTVAVSASFTPNYFYIPKYVNGQLNGVYVDSAPGGTIKAVFAASTIPTVFTLGSLSQTYDGSVKTATFTRNPANATYTASLTSSSAAAGSYPVSITATAPYTGSASGTLVINKANQSISFGNPGGKIFGFPVTLSATATSGLPVTFSVVAGSATVSGNVVTATAQGNVTIRASQAGNSNFNAAANVDNTFVFNNTSPAAPTLTLSGAALTTGAQGETALYLGDSLAISGTIHDDDGNLTTHNLSYRYFTGATPGPWALLPGTDGTPSNRTDSAKSVSFTPSQPGQWEFNGNGTDGLIWPTGASKTLWVYGASNNSSVSSYSINGVANATSVSVAPGQTFPVSITLRNTDNRPWTTDAHPHKLVASLTGWGADTVPLPVTSVFQNAEVTFTFNVVAPTVVGTYAPQWQMAEYFNGSPTRFGVIVACTVVANRAPAVSMSASPASISFGQTTTVSATATDADGNLAFHGILALNQAGNDWYRSPSTDHSTGWGNHPTSTDFVSANYTSGVVSGGSSTRSVVHRPSWIGTLTYHSNAYDGFVWASPDGYTTVAVGKATPTGTFAARSPNPSVSATYTIVAGDLNATFANPYSTAVAAPTGTTTYSVVACPLYPAEVGRTLTAGSTLTAGAAYTIRATYPGDANYNGTTLEPTWTVLKGTQSAVTTSGGTTTYGTPFTPVASGGNGSGAYQWEIVAGGTASGAAINSTTGVITTTSTGTVLYRVRGLGDSLWNDSAWSTPNSSLNVGTRAITVTLAGSKAYDTTTASTGASASITTGSLAPGDTIGYAFASTSSANVGSYTGLTTATVSNATAPTARTGNYAITYAGSYAITKAPQAAVSVSASPTSIYTSTSSAITASGGSGTGAWTITATGGTLTGSGATRTFTATIAGSYIVSATKAGDPNYIDSSTATTPPISVVVDTTPPTPPTGLAAPTVGSTSFTLSWVASTDNVGVTDYEVYKDGAPVGRTGGALSKLITGLTVNTEYSMTVRALDLAGNPSDPSVAKKVKTVLSDTGDDDFDGMPNKWESDHALNPLDSADALQVKFPNGDGLTNVAKYHLGLDPRVATDPATSIGSAQTVAWPAANTTKTDAVGATAGTLGVNEGGAATYTIPIYTPPGIAGVEPSLALTYSSNGPNGLVGVGWSLSGLSSITRGASNKILYPQIDAIEGDSNRFFLDGNRLMLVSGTDQTDGAEYRTAKESFAKVVYRKDADGKVWFDVWSKTGLHMRYGKTAFAGFAVLPLVRVDDHGGNFMEIEYSTDLAPLQIVYSGHQNESVTTVQPFNIIRFGYENRPDPMWLGMQGQYTTSLTVSQRLARIDVLYRAQNGTETAVRSYALAFDESGFTGRSRLTDVREEGAEPTTGARPKFGATSFVWNTEALNYSSGDTFNCTQIASGTLTDANATVFAGDFNNDGRTDILSMEPFPRCYSTVLVSNGTSFVAKSTRTQLNPDTDFNNGRISVGDLDGDGVCDVTGWFMKSSVKSSTRIENTLRHYAWITNVDTSGNVALGTRYNAIPEQVLTQTGKYQPGGTVVVRKPFEMLMSGGSAGGSLLLNAYSETYDSLSTWQLMRFNLPTQTFQTVQSGIGRSIASERIIVPIEMNSDGRTDILAFNDIGNLGGSDFNTSSAFKIYTETTDEYGTIEQLPDETTTDVWPGDFNGDGLTESIVHFSRPNGSKRTAGLSFFSYYRYPEMGFERSDSGDWYNHYGIVGDFNEDGRDDLIVQRSFADINQPEMWFAVGTSTAPFKLKWVGYFPQGPKYNESCIPMDFDGDGRLELFIRTNGSADYRVVKIHGATNGSTPPSDVIVGVSTPMGCEQTVVYAPLTDSTVYTKGVAVAGMPSVQRPINVVKSITTSDVPWTSSIDASGNPVAATTTYTSTYKYEGLRCAANRGLLGFASQEVTDSRTGIKVRTERQQEYPYTGFVIKTTTSLGAAVLSETTAAPDKWDLQWGTGVYQTVLVYPKTVTAKTWDLNGALTSNVTTTQVVNDLGNVTSTTANYNLEGRTLTTSALYYAADTTNWLIGRLQSVRSTAVATGLTTVERKTEYTYGVAGKPWLLSQTVAKSITTPGTESHDVAQQLTTDLSDFDEFGHAKTVKVTGYVDATTSQTRTTTYTYDSLGRFVTSISRSIPGQVTLTESIESNQVFAAPSKHTDANGQETTFEYDPFGRLKTCKDIATGVTTTVSLQWTSDPTGLYASETKSTYNNGNSLAGPPSFAVYDKLGRPTRTATINADGHPVWNETYYNAKGQVVYTSTPWRQLPANWNFTTNPQADYTAAGKPIRGWTSLEYDTLGRAKKSTLPNNTVVAYTYAGLEATSTATATIGGTSVSHKSRSVSDLLGRVKGIYRNEGLGTAVEQDSITYAYDAAGNLCETKAAGTVSKITYDQRGLPLTYNDPDTGTRTYKYNAFGELYWIKDAKGKITTLAYDLFGRVTTRVNDDGTTSWNYDSAPGKSKGLLASVTGPDLGGGTSGETFTYDTGLSRLATATKTINGQSFTTTPGYDAISRVDSVRYDSPGGRTQRLGYGRNALGYQREIRDMTAGGQVLWGLRDVDAYGHPVTEFLGNGVLNTSLYDPTDGVLRKRYATSMAGTFEDLTYAVDGFGNVRSRTFASGVIGTSRTETYDFDLLDRLTAVKLDGITKQTIAYHASGNITDKSDVGSYEYTSTSGTVTRPHAVSKAGSTTYDYDANGNNTQRNGVEEIWWAVSNVPTKIARNGAQSTFRYDADGNRTQQVRSNGETTYYAGAGHEYVQRSGQPDEYRYHIVTPGGRSAQISRGVAGGGTIRYETGDHLGSIEGVSDDYGRSLESLSYDSWGRRRLSTWQAGNPPASAINRGYTGHEMLDDLGLVHMNGRIYDPVLARVLSADPVNSQPGNPQRYNPYSYVLNNPQRYTDPSGYDGNDPWVTADFYHFSGERDLSGLDVYSEYRSAQSRGDSGWFSFSASSGGTGYGRARDFNSLVTYQMRPLVHPSMVRNGCQNQGLGGNSALYGGKGLPGIGQGRAVTTPPSNAPNRESMSSNDLALARAIDAVDSSSVPWAGRFEVIEPTLDGGPSWPRTLPSDVAGLHEWRAARKARVQYARSHGISENSELVYLTAYSYWSHNDPKTVALERVAVFAAGGMMMTYSGLVEAQRFRIPTIDDFIANPNLLAGRGPAEIEKLLGEVRGWRVETLGQGSRAGQGWVFREYTPAGNPTGRMLRWHPGGGHHGPNPYWRATGGPYGKSGVIPGGAP